jgi:hypothetical protein
MPEFRKLIILGNARGVTLPAKWLDNEEARLGRTIEHVILEMVDHSIIIKMEGSINQQPAEEIAATAKTE